MIGTGHDGDLVTYPRFGLTALSGDLPHYDFVSDQPKLSSRQIHPDLHPLTSVVGIDAFQEVAGGVLGWRLKLGRSVGYQLVHLNDRDIAWPHSQPHILFQPDSDGTIGC